MITGSLGIVFVWINTLMLIANATVTTINSYSIWKEVKKDAKNKE
jgi:hypothetical protein